MEKNGECILKLGNGLGEISIDLFPFINPFASRLFMHLICSGGILYGEIRSVLPSLFARICFEMSDVEMPLDIIHKIVEEEAGTSLSLSLFATLRKLKNGKMATLTNGQQ